MWGLMNPFLSRSRIWTGPRRELPSANAVERTRWMMPSHASPQLTRSVSRKPWIAWKGQYIHMNPKITYRPTIPLSGFIIRLNNVTKKQQQHGVSLGRLTSSQWSNSYRFFFRPGSNSRRRTCSSSSVIKPVLTCTWEPTFCTSSRLDPKMSSSSEADKGRLLAQPRRPAPAAGLWIRFMTVSNSFILLFQMLTVISNCQYFWRLASSWVSKWSVWEPCLKRNAHWEMSCCRPVRAPREISE